VGRKHTKGKFSYWFFQALPKKVRTEPGTRTEIESIVDEIIAEAVAESIKAINEPCPDCNGQGFYKVKPKPDGRDRERCNGCGGTGFKNR
jgi:hypothetical protein